MKTIVLLIATSAILSAHAEPPKAMTAEITHGVFITLTNEPCTMYEMPKDVFLWKASGEDKTVKETATGCFQLEDDMVIINLVNDKNGNEYGYVLKQELFKPVEVY